MSAEQFNSLGGFSVGIPPIPIADANGNLVSNFNNLSGNVSANKVYANTYYYANGQPFNASPGGNTTQLQFNNNGVLGGIPGVTYSSNVLSLGNVSNLRILGGQNGYYLQTDGAGSLTWSPAGNVAPGNGNPGGANSQVQFNDEGQFGGSAGFTYDKETGELTVTQLSSPTVVSDQFIGNGAQLTDISVDTANYVTQSVQSNITQVGNLTALTVAGTSNLGPVSNVRITGGVNGYVLSTDGTGNLSWTAGAGGSSPGGANSQIQFNDNGLFGGSAALTFNKVSNTVVLNGNATVKTFVANNTTIYGNADVTGNVSAQYFNGNGAYLTGITPDTANYVSQPNQSNITSVGTLTSLAVSGNIISGQSVSAAGFQTSGNANVGTLRVTNNANISGTLNASGNVNLSASGNITIGTIANLHIPGGLNGYVIQTDGLGNLTWAAGGGGGGGNTNPGGANTQVQYNSDGEFAASPFFTYDDATKTVQVGGKLIANSMQLGSGSYKFGSSSVFFATTATTAKTRLYTIPVSECSGVNFEIIGTDSAGSKRQSVNISSLYYAGVVQYSEYGGVFINGGVGDFTVEYNPGDVITPPSLDLNVVPDTSNSTVYKLWITILAP